MKILNLIHLASLSLLLASCTFKKVDKLNHEGAVETKPVTIEEVSPEVRTQNLQEINLTEISSAIEKGTNISVINNALDKIQTSIFQNGLIDQIEMNRNKKVENLLSLYNLGIIKAAALGKADQARLDYYQKLIFNGCDQQLRGCLNISTFMRDHRSLQVVLKVIENLDAKMEATCKDNCNQEIKLYYDLLAIAHDVKNAIRNNDLEFYYLKRARDYGRYYNSLSDAERNSNFFRRHGLIFENIVSQYPADPKNPKFAEFVQAFKPWSYSKLEANPFPFGIQRMFNYAASHFLYSEKSLNKDLQAAITSSQIEADKAGISFKNAVIELQNDKDSSQIFKNLKIDVEQINSNKIFNEYFYMVDRLYRGHLDFDEVNAIWTGSKKDEQLLIQVVDIYIKVELIRKIVSTNKYMTSIFLKKDIPGDALFKKVIQDSEPLAKEWGVMISQMDRIALFVSRQLREINAKSKSLQDAQLLIDSIKSNIRYLSVYPNMLLMGYVMISMNASLSFTTWWGMKISIDPKTVMNLLLDGEFSPWFNFGGDSNNLEKSQLIYAYHFALNTGAFDIIFNY